LLPTDSPPLRLRDRARGSAAHNRPAELAVGHGYVPSAPSSPGSLASRGARSSPARATTWRAGATGWPWSSPPAGRAYACATTPGWRFAGAPRDRAGRPRSHAVPLLPGSSPRARPRNPRRWEPRIGVRVADWLIRRMRTGLGHVQRGRPPHLAQLRTGQEAAALHRVRRRPRVAHLVEPKRNERFREILDRVMPQWRLRAEELNRTRPAHDEWEGS